MSDTDNALRDLSEVTSATRTIQLKVRSTLVTVSEVTMAGLAPFIRACAPFLSTFDQLGEVKEQNEELEAAGGSTRQLADKFGFFKLIGENTNAFLDAATLVCEVETRTAGAGCRDFLSRLRPDEFFHIALAVVEVNGDFFILRLAPAMEKFFHGVGRIGLSPTSVSSLQGILDLNSPATDTASSGGGLPH